jgi:hypothetical protein
LTVFTAQRARVVHPGVKGLMLSRGSVIALEPEKYELHAELAAKLRRGGWSEVSDAPPPEAPRPPMEPSDSGEDAGDRVYPHQAEIIERLRARVARPPTET